MPYAVSALFNQPSGRLQHALWVLDAASADEAEAQAMTATLRAGALVSVLVKAVDKNAPALAVREAESR